LGLPNKAYSLSQSSPNEVIDHMQLWIERIMPELEKGSAERWGVYNLDSLTSLTQAPLAPSNGSLNAIENVTQPVTVTQSPSRKRQRPNSGPLEPNFSDELPSFVQKSESPLPNIPTSSALTSLLGNLFPKSEKPDLALISNDTTQTTSIKMEALKEPCRFKLCELGNFITHASKITSKTTGQEYSIPPGITCRDYGVFIIECKLKIGCKTQNSNSNTECCPYQTVMGCKQMYIYSLNRMISLFKKYFEGEIDEKNRGMKHCIHIVKDHSDYLAEMKSKNKEIWFEDCYSVTYVEKGGDDLKNRCNDWKIKLGIPVS